MDIQRRQFLKVSSLTAGGFALSFPLGSYSKEKNTSLAELINVIQGVDISPSGRITIRVFKQEMGHGIATGLAMAVAEEMDANWDDVTVEMLKYAANMQPEDKIHRYDTGGSSGVFTEFTPMRILGATVKDMLRRAAAKKWAIDKQHCLSANGIVTNQLTDEQFHYGELANLAATLEIVIINDLKTADKYSILGQPIASNKNKRVVNGNLNYSIDINRPNTLIAMIVRPPCLESELVKFDASQAKEIAGVVDIFALDPLPAKALFFKGVRGGVAIVAKSTWACIQARKLLNIQWREVKNSTRSSEQVYDELAKYRDETEGKIRFASGDVEQGLLSAKSVIKAEYTSPYIAHGLMETLNATAEFEQNGKLNIWVGTQSPFETVKNIHLFLGIDKKLITIYPHPMGGGYGRRYFADYVIETVLLAKRYQQPVKLIWSREDEIQFDSVHPLRKDYCQCGVDENGNIQTFAIDAVSTHEWGGMEVPWFYGHQQLLFRSWFYSNRLLQWGSWRAVVMHLDIFSRECFLDEVAHSVGEDPLEYRIKQVKQPIPKGNSPEELKQYQRLTVLRRHHLRSFELIKKLSKWHKKRAANVGLGVATIAYGDKSICTQVAEVIVDNNKVRVSKIYCVADVGFVVNPNLVKGQIEGSILWGLTPVLHGGVDVENGKIVQDNFDNMPLARMYEAPEIIIHLENHENRPPSGAGEFAVPPVAPAILNAVFAATGKRIRTLNLPKEFVA